MLNYIKYGLLIVVVGSLAFKMFYYKNKNYNLSKKIEQLEAINSKCISELNIFKTMYNGLNNIYNLDIKDIKNENNDTNNTVIFDFNSL